VALFELAQRVAKIGGDGDGERRKRQRQGSAGAIHPHAIRVCAGPFVAINCAAIPEHFTRSHALGYEKGAFTGAAQSQPGNSNRRRAGPCLLDEVSEMPLALQAKLLRVLQEREVERVGGPQAIELNLRLLAASNRDCARPSIRACSARTYTTAQCVPAVIPPLREAFQDIVPMAQHILAA